MDSGRFTPIVRAAILDSDDHSVIQYLDLVYFKINGIYIEIEFYDDAGGFTDSVALERGVKVGNTEYTIFSGIYKLTTSYKVQGGKYGLYICSGSLIEPAGVNLAGVVSYHTIIDNFLALGSCTATWKNPAAAWLNYQFLIDGGFFHTSNIYTFFSLLKQKYLIHATENGPDSILFFSAADSLALASQYTLTLNDVDIWSAATHYRQFVWKDEAGVIHTDGAASYPVHNLGYLESTAVSPNIPDHQMPIADTLVTVIPNLKYQTGDCVSFDPGITGVSAVKTVVDVTEIFDARTKTVKNPRYRLSSRPTWKMQLRPLLFFSNTEAGHIESSAGYTSPFIPLATSGFSGFLNQSVTNLQVLADFIDDNAIGNAGIAGTAGRLAQFSAGHSIEDSNIIGPAANVLTIEATGIYTLTIPATGTAALLDTANVFTDNQTVQGQVIAYPPYGSTNLALIGGDQTEGDPRYTLYLKPVYVMDADHYVNFPGADFTFLSGGTLDLRGYSVSAINDGSLAILSGLNTGSFLTDSVIRSHPGTNAHSGIGIDHNSATAPAGQQWNMDLVPANLTANRMVTFPNVTGTAAIGAGTITSSTTNDVTTSTHTHAITASPALVGAGTAQGQVIVAGANPYAPVFSGFLLSGTTGGKTTFAVTNTKTLTLTCSGTYNLTIPATGTVALLSAENSFSVGQQININTLTFPGLVLQTMDDNVTCNLLDFWNSDGDSLGSVSPVGAILFNATSNATADFTWNTDNYVGIFGDASNNSVVFLSNAAGKVGFFGHAASVQPSAYTPSNVVADRSYDANATTIDELSDVLGTLIADLQTLGLVA